MKKLLAVFTMVMALFIVNFATNADAQTNLALDGVASQYSTYGSHYASNCNDGNTNGNAYTDPICHTQLGGEYWWKVDLLNTHPIGKIVVWGRTDSIDTLCSRLNDYIVSVLDEAGNTVWSQQATDCPRYSTTFNVPHNVFGRYVKIEEQIPDGYLNMAEVQVFAPISIPLVMNVVPKKMNIKAGKVPVAIFSSETFDVRSIDTTSLTFGATGNEQSLSHCDYQDIDLDGHEDLVCHFNKDLTGFISGSGETTAFLKGGTVDWDSIYGNDAVWIIK